MKQYQTRNLVTADAGTTVIIRRAGDTKTPGEFGYMTVLLDSAHTIAFYDGETSAGTLIGTKPASIAAGTYWFKRPVTGGLCAVVAASFAGNIVIGYN